MEPLGSYPALCARAPVPQGEQPGIGIPRDGPSEDMTQMLSIPWYHFRPRGTQDGGMIWVGWTRWSHAPSGAMDYILSSYVSVVLRARYGLQ